MKYFQSISFIFEIFFLIIIITLGILYSLNIIKDEKSWLKSGKVYKIIIEIIARVAIFLLLIYWGYVSLLPRVIDIPKLITGRLTNITGYPFFGDRGSKDLFEHIYINGTELNFFIDSGIKSREIYKVSYLPKSHRAIMIEKADPSVTYDKQVGVPWQTILGILYMLLVVLLFNKYAFWFLGVGSLIYYPLNIYFYYSYGKSKGAWLPNNNDALVNIIGGLGFLLMILVLYLIEKLLKHRFPVSYVSKFGDSKDSYITKYMSHMTVFVYILLTLSYLKLI
ncbi:hypothetical protein [Candidatus Clostridium radicumherbarum]|uniref:Uncharacterized protein n=1 Tax=Candidatus Clostridium radicumherbarum TaxID=3381662 RepID=A0ABW8TVL0_9CLOT